MFKLKIKVLLLTIINVLDVILSCVRINNKKIICIYIAVELSSETKGKK